MPARDHRIQRRAQVAACNGLIVAEVLPPRTAVIQLSTVDQPHLRVEQKKVRRAGRAIGPRHLLALIQQVREAPPQPRGLLAHPVRAVFRILLNVVGLDRRDGNWSRAVCAKVVLANPGKLLFHVLHIRAVNAHEHHQQALFPAQRKDVIAAQRPAAQHVH